MNRTQRNIALGMATVVATAACGRSAPTDNSLAANGTAGSLSQDLDLASHARDQQMVVSAVEVAPTSAPKAATHKRVPKPSLRPTERVAAEQARVAAPSPEPVTHEPAPVAPSPQATAPAPRPQPVQQAPAERQPGVYSSEAEIFRKMPWIRP